jgi:hypothetical protein
MEYLQSSSSYTSEFFHGTVAGKINARPAKKGTITTLGGDVLRLYNDTEILDAVQVYMFSSDHADLVGYRTQSLERDLADKRVFVHSMRRVCHLGSMTNARVLDVGCGSVGRLLRCP